MSVRRLDPVQPEKFAFTPANLKWAKALIGNYPKGRQASAVIPLLWRAQEQTGGWLTEPALRAVADFLDMAYIRVYEIATFYTMFNLSPVGKHYVQLCGTTPCWLRGADSIKEVCRRVIGEQGQVTEDGMFSWIEVECLRACTNAPMVQINKDYYEDLTPESFEKILVDLREGREVKPGPQNGRQFSAPEGGPTTLLEQSNVRKQDRTRKDPGRTPKRTSTSRTKNTPANDGSVDVKVTPSRQADAQKLADKKKGKPALRYTKSGKSEDAGYDKPPVGGESKAWRTPKNTKRSGSAKKPRAGGREDE